MEKPVVGIVMGSDSDLPVVKEAALILEQFSIPFEMRIISAHRTPEKAADYAETAAERGLEVIIAAAGGAAHLAGVLAADTPLPVIGLPIKSAALSGVDSLYSIVQMPSGIPVATVAINGSKNAAYLALQIIGTKHAAVREKLLAERKEMEENAMKANEEVTAKFQG